MVAVPPHPADYVPCDFCGKPMLEGSNRCVRCGARYEAADVRHFDRDWVINRIDELEQQLREAKP